MPISKRDLLKWSTPAIAMVALPAHAQTSTTTASPPEPEPTMCSSDVVVDLTFAAVGSLFGIDAECGIGSGINNAFVEEYNVGNNFVIFDVSHVIRIDNIRLVAGGVAESSNIRVVDAIGRSWFGNLTFSYDGARVSAMGSMSLD